MTNPKNLCVDRAVGDAGIVATLLSIATEMVNEMDYELPDGQRNTRLGQLNGLLFAAEELAKKLVDTVDALPRPQVQS